MTAVLFVCKANRGRSQISQALFMHAAGTRHRAVSAGSEADSSERIYPAVLDAMREIGIDLADRVPQRLTRELAEQAELVVTMGCGDACPYIPGKRYIDWELRDPADLSLDDVRALRDDIEKRVARLIDELDEGEG